MLVAYKDIYPKEKEGFAMLNFDLCSYFTGLTQRCSDFTDVMQKRGIQQKSLEEDGCSGVFIFPYKTLISGMDLSEPINYDLLKVKGENVSGKRPFVFVDPKAGRGPGICGSKEVSEVGLALKNGNPVYFIYFHSEPAAGQTMEKVFRGIAHFIEHVKSENPYTEDPVLVGNCQAGWLLAIISARYLRHFKCPLILVGSPLSYWAGSGSLKHKGFLSGGSVWAAFLADVNRGVFDGANLSLNFEIHDGSQVVGKKLFTLFKDPRPQAESFIENERWWNFFCHMTKEEIVWIIDNLFIGNRIERGELYVDGEYVELRNITGPVIVFFSEGDTITAPAQAVNWIRRTYEEDEKFGAPIVYVVHPTCGHLGIFVSSSVARDYHQKVFDEVESICQLLPGLYELIPEPGKIKCALERRTLDFTQQFVERNDEEDRMLAFLSRQSEIFRSFYEMTWGPYVRSMFNGFALTDSHPMRSSRKFYGGNLKYLCSQTEPVSMDDNLFKKSEDLFLNFFVDWWKHWEDVSASIIQCTMKNLIAFSP
ncbi:MAG: DUF3141 domain-containing protein [Patescibacteria group bacterium]